MKNLSKTYTEKYIKTFDNFDNNDYIAEKLNLNELFYQLKNNINKKIAVTLIIGGLMSIFNTSQAINYIETNNDLNDNEKTEIINAIPKYKDPTKMKLSDDGWEFIRNNEKFRDHCYDLNDGKITFGFGHAEPKKTTKYKVGQKISFDEAYRLYIDDVNVAASGIKRMFNEWKSKGINIKITQNQYDACVDLAYNIGVSAFRQSDFAKALKKYDLQKAAKLLKTTCISSEFKDGHSKRRKAEYILFITN